MVQKMGRTIRRYIAFVIWDRSSQTGAKLKKKLDALDVGRYFSDHWRSYAELFGGEKLRQTKSETYTVEGFNCRIRHYLARFKRRTLCYSKSEMMLANSLNLLLLKLNNSITI